MHHSGLTFLLEKDGNDTAFLIGVVYLPVISARFKHKPGQCEPLFVPAGIYGMVSKKVPRAAWCSHLGGSSAGWLNY